MENTVYWYVILIDDLKMPILKMGAARSSEMLVNVCHTTRRHILRGSILHAHRRESLKPHKSKILRKARPWFVLSVG
jgi:hypothetical protein